MSPCEILHIDFHGDSCHVIGNNLETRISLWWLHYLCALMTKRHLFGPHVSQSIPCWGLSGGVAVWTVAADNPTLCELALPYNGSIVETHSPGRRDWVYTRCREVWVQGARVQGLQQQWVNQRRAVFWWSADNGTRSETREICATFHMVLVQIILYVPTIATCVSAQIHLVCDQISENMFLIRAIVSLIFLNFSLYPIESSAVIINCSLKLLRHLFLEFQTFSDYSLTAGESPSPLGALPICLHRQLAAVHNHCPQNPFFILEHYCSSWPPA